MIPIFFHKLLLPGISFNFFLFFLAQFYLLHKFLSQFLFFSASFFFKTPQFCTMVLRLPDNLLYFILFNFILFHFIFLYTKICLQLLMHLLEMDFFKGNDKTSIRVHAKDSPCSFRGISDLRWSDLLDPDTGWCLCSKLDLVLLCISRCHLSPKREKKSHSEYC